MGDGSGERRLTLRRAELRPLFIALAFVAALALGVVGYQDAEPGLDLRTAVFQAVQLFVLEGGVVQGATPWALETARFLAPAVLGYAAIRGVMVLARDQLTLWKTRLFTRGHVLVVGDSHRMATLIDQLLGDGRSVVVVTPQPALLRGHRERGAAVLEGDPTDRFMVAQGRPDRATDVVVLLERDVDALRTLAACEAASDDQGAATHIALNEERLWEELHTVGFAGSRHLEFFLVADREARVLLRGVVEPTLVIEAEGTLLERLVATAGRAALLDQRTLDVVLGPRAVRERAALVDASPWLSDAVRFVDEETLDSGERCAVVVAGIGDAAAIAFGARIARSHPAASVRVAVADASVKEALLQTRLSEPNLELIPATEIALGATLITDSVVEILARAKHDDYVARESARGMDVAANPSMVAWDELPTSLQQSNRRYAQSVATKLDAIGASLTPLTASVAAGDLALPANVLEELAQGEHDRWMNDLLRDGWQPTLGAKDPGQKLHPLLVPWDKLDEVERDKDRDGFRAMPQLMARAGYELTLPRDSAAT